MTKRHPASSSPKIVIAKASASKAPCKCCGVIPENDIVLLCPECKNGQTWFDIQKYKHPAGFLLMTSVIFPLFLLLAASLYSFIQKKNEEAEKRIAEVQAAVSAIRSAETSFRASCFATVSNDCRKALDGYSERYISQVHNFSFVIGRVVTDAEKSLALFGLGAEAAQREYYIIWHNYLRCTDSGIKEEQCAYSRDSNPGWNAAAALYVADYLACKAESNLNHTFFLFNKSDSHYCETILLNNKPLAFDEPSRLPVTIDRSRDSEEILKILRRIINEKLVPGSGAMSDPLRTKQPVQGAQR